VSVRIDAYADRPFPGVVSYISPEAEFTPKSVQTREERVNLVFGVRVSVPNPDGSLKIGLPVDVEIPKRRAAEGAGPGLSGGRQ
jgi:HlyD family secretion protein